MTEYPFYEIKEVEPKNPAWGLLRLTKEKICGGGRSLIRVIAPFQTGLKLE